jgi:hypothetical protein
MRLLRILSLSFLLLFTTSAFAADQPKLRQGMNLQQARGALQSAGWIVPKSSQCLTHSGLRDASDERFKTGECISMFTDRFYLDFTEFFGASLNGVTVSGLYSDGFGKCLEVIYSYSELDTESEDLAKKIKVDSWYPRDCAR